MEESKKKEEGDVKNNLINDIIQISSVFSKEIEGIERTLDDLGIQKNLSNIGIILNNKLVEIQQQLKKVGLSIFPQKYEDGTYVYRSFVGNSIIEDLTEYLNSGSQCLDKYNSTMREILSRETKENTKNENGSLGKSNPIKRFFLKIRNIFKPQVIETVYHFTEDDIDNIIIHLVDYENASKNIYEYNLKENVTSSLIKAIREQKYKADMVPELLEKEIVPDLRKLGLEDLVSKLQEGLIEEYKKDISAFQKDAIKDEDMYLYVPDFSRYKGSNRKNNYSSLFREDDFKTGLKVNVNYINSSISETKKTKEEEQDLEK